MFVKKCAEKNTDKSVKSKQDKKQNVSVWQRVKKKHKV